MELFGAIVALYGIIISGVAIGAMHEWYTKLEYKAPKRLQVLTAICFLLSAVFIFFFL